MFRHVVRRRLRQTPKLESHVTPASLRSIFNSASLQRPRAYDKVRTELGKDGGNREDAPEELGEHAGRAETTTKLHLGTMGKNAADKIKVIKLNVQGNGTARPDSDSQRTRPGSRATVALPEDFADRYLTSAPPVPPRAPEDDPDAAFDPPFTFYENQLKNQLLASFLPANQQALTDPTLAVICPIEGGEYIVRETINKAASLVNADVVRVEAIECLGLRQYGGLGQAGECLQLSSNPVLLDEQVPAALPDQAEQPQMIAFEDEGEEGEHAITFGQPIEISLPMPGHQGFPQGMPSVMMKEELGVEFTRRMNKTKIDKLMSDVVNVTDQRNHSAPESSKQGAQVRRRIIYIQDAVAMASTFDQWFPFLLKAVRARRRAGLSSKESNLAVSQPTTIVLGCTPSILHVSENLRVKRETEAMAEEGKQAAAAPDRPPMPPALMNLLNGLRRGGSSGGSENAADEAWKGSEEDDVLGRRTRLKKRLKRFRLSDERELRTLLPEFGQGADKASENGPSMSGGIIDMSAMWAGANGRSRRGRGSTEASGPSGDSDTVRPWKVLGTLPLKRDVNRERRERQQQRLRINSLLLRKAIGLQGGTMTTEALATELGSDDPMINSSVHQELVDLRDSFADTVWPWLTVQHLASIAIGHSLSAASTSEQPAEALIPVTWKAIAEASIVEEAGEGQAAAFAATCNSHDKESTDAATRAASGKAKAEPARDAVIEGIKRDKTLNAHEKRLLGCIVDPTKLSSTSFEDVYLPEKTIDAVRSVVTLPLIYPEAFNTGILAQHSTGNALLFGPPGTGKTLLARALARESGARMLAIQPSDVTDMYVGEGEKLVKAVFSLARRMSPCIVFLDEVDSLFGARSSQSSGGAQAHRQILTEFMQEMDGLSSASKNREQRIVVIGATNRPYDLDEAVLRRLPRRLLVDLPGQSEREAILRILLKNEKLAGDVDLKKIAEQTDTYSGSDLKHLCVSAALASLKETVHLPWKSKTTSWAPANPGDSTSPPSGPSSPAFQHTFSPTELEEPAIPNEALPQPQMQRFRPQVQSNSTTNLLRWDHPSPKKIKVHVTPLHIHGLASTSGNLTYETSLLSQQNRSNDEQDSISKPRLPARIQAQELDRSTVEMNQQEHAPTVASATQGRRRNHVDELLRTPAYLGLKVPGEIVKLLRERLYRMAAFYTLSQVALRTDAQLLSLVQETIHLDMLSLTSGRPHDLAVRLGWTTAGARRGPVREALHQEMVIRQGRLPSVKQVEKAVMEDGFDPHGRFDTIIASNSASQSTTTTVSLDLNLSQRSVQDSTTYYNQQLHNQILGGAKANQIRKDGQKAVRHSRPTGGLHQLSALLHKVQELKRDRGFQPDWVTVNLVVKTWLRGLAAGPQKSPFGADDIFKAFKKTLTMDSVKKQNLDFDRDIQPLVKMLVKALKNNGEWLKAREVLAWMVEIRETIAAQVASTPKPDIDDGKMKPNGRLSQTEKSKATRSGPSASTFESAMEAENPKSNDTEASAPAPVSLERIISMKHFEIAMKEITPSSSESGNLPELRKWASQYGEGGTERGKKSGYGSKFGFGDDKVKKQEAGYGRVRPEEE